jgi:leader peptidase (prepilin peptidase) / N-methyltransferase
VLLLILSMLSAFLLAGPEVHAEGTLPRMLVATALLALLGAIVGSYISVVAYRVPRGLSLVPPRPRCPCCRIPIAALDSLPVLSWLLLRGRCRHCTARIPAIYPVVEAGLAAGFAGAYLRFGDDAVATALACVFLATLATITLTDLEQRLIPNKVLIASALVGLALVLAGERESIDERAIAAAAAFAGLFAVVLIHPQGMGMGDVKLAAVMGLYLGRAVAPALLIGFAAGALYGAVLILRHGAEARKRAVPFGPFLAVGGIVGLFAGDKIVDWYLASFFDPSAGAAGSALACVERGSGF